MPQLPRVEYHEQEKEEEINDKKWLQQPMKCLSLTFKEQKHSTPDKNFVSIVLYGVRLKYNGASDKKLSMQKCILPLTILEDSPPLDIGVGLQKFGVFLHPTIALPSKMPHEKTESLSPQKFVAKRLDHPSLLLLFLFGLATGEAQIDELTVRQPIRDPLNQTKSSKTLASTKQSQLIAIAGAEGMLLRSICNYPQEFQLMVNRVLQMETITKSARNFLSIIRVNASRGLTQTHLCNAAAAEMAKQIDLGFNCLHITICDNLGFADKANHDPSKIGTLQTTQIIDIIISEEQLQAEGILDKDGNILLSSTPSNTHADLVEEEGVVERLISVSQDAIDSLTECVAEAMMTAISDCLKGNFAVGKRRLRSARFISLQTKGGLLCGTDIGDMHPEDLDAFIAADAIPTPNTPHHQYPVLPPAQHDLPNHPS